MKKIFISIAVLVVIIGIVVTIGLSKLDEIIASAIETEGTSALGSKVSVSSVETNLSDGLAVIKGMTIANPSGYKKANAIEIGSFSASVDYKSQAVNDISIISPTINAEILGKLEEIVKNREFDSIRSNFKDLLDNMPPDEDEDVVEEDGEDTVITIKRFAIEKASINLTADMLGERKLNMNDLVLNNLKGTPDQLSDQITEKVTNHITKQIQTYATKELTSILGDVVKAKVTEKINDEIKDKLEGELGDKLGGRLRSLKLKF